MKKVGNLEFDQNQISKFCEEHDISYLALFGSYLHGDDKYGSDIDLLVSFSKEKGLIDFVRIQSNLEKALKRPVDLVTKNALSPYLKDRIMSEAVTLYEQKE